MFPCWITFLSFGRSFQGWNFDLLHRRQSFSSWMWSMKPPLSGQLPADPWFSPPGPDSANTDHPALRGWVGPPGAPRPHGHCPLERTWGGSELGQASALSQPPPRLPLHCWDDFCFWNTSVFYLLTFSRWQEADNCALFVDIIFWKKEHSLPFEVKLTF